MAQRIPSSRPGAAGILPISVAATHPTGAGVPRTSLVKASTPRLKLLIRRLPPGLVRAEFSAALGEEWAVGNGRIDWFIYKPGKVATDPSKPSKPSRAYLRVTSSSFVEALSIKVRQTTFHDTRNTFTDPALLGPPTLEFAPYPRVPGGKTRKDARLGTIDQDPEFIAFLESLTNPLPKANPDDIFDVEKEEKTVITPLIQFLKEKKASKAKEANILPKSTKSSRTAPKDAKTEKIQAKKVLSRAEKATASTSPEKQGRADRVVKDSIKLSNKHPQAVKSKCGKLAATGNQSDTPSTPTPQKPAERKRERGNLSAATNMLRRDLGLTPPRKRGDKGNTTQEQTRIAANLKQNPLPGPAEVNKHEISTSKTIKDEAILKNAPPKLLKKPPTEPAAARNSPKTINPPPSPKVAIAQNGATQAFLKHANPSQGVTEELLEIGFSKYGKVVKVEIDKKKGFGYVDFLEPEGLRKAIQASPVQIAESQVVVLERRSTANVSLARGYHNRANTPSPAMASHLLSRGGGNSGAQVASRPAPQGPRGGGRGGRYRGNHARGARNSSTGTEKMHPPGISAKQGHSQPLG
ncbi:hypothetical protein LOZ65_005914 [Ophidiomyces ophidiicola]|nr:hypothetical protein LOZ65_005914 [Ophidiomyces ophidiicola]